MGNLNDILLYGMLHSEPVLRYDKTEGCPDRQLKMVMVNILVVRGIQKYGAVNGRLKQDMPIIISTKEKIMDVMKDWHIGDIVMIKGKLTSTDVIRHSQCPGCGKLTDTKEVSYYVTPMFVKRDYVGVAPQEALDIIKQCSEISNRAILGGTVSDNPDIYKTRLGQRITNYRISSKRKIKADLDNTAYKYDFIPVKAYGKTAESDFLALKAGSELTIEGMLQIRGYPSVCKCAYCGGEHSFTRYRMEVIPYYTEYNSDLRDESDRQNQNLLLNSLKKEEGIIGGQKIEFSKNDPTTEYS